MSKSSPIYSISPEDWGEFSSELSKETDRGASLVGAAFLEDRLGALIEGFLLDDPSIIKQLLKGPAAPLGSLYNRINSSYLLGLISEDEFNDLSIIREIRNAFAHSSKSLSFSTARIKVKIEKLRIPHLILDEKFDTHALAPRQLFINATSMIATFLELRRKDIKDRRTPAKKFRMESIKRTA